MVAENLSLKFVPLSDGSWCEFLTLFFCRQQLELASEKLRNLSLQTSPSSEASGSLEREQALTATLNTQIKQLQADLREKVAEIGAIKQAHVSSSSSQVNSRQFMYRSRWHSCQMGTLEAKIQTLITENSALKSEQIQLQQDAAKVKQIVLSLSWNLTFFGWLRQQQNPNWSVADLQPLHSNTRLLRNNYLLCNARTVNCKLLSKPYRRADPF